MNFFICQRQSTTQLSLWFIKVSRSDCSLPKNSKTLDSVENYFKVTATDQVKNSTYLLYDIKVCLIQLKSSWGYEDLNLSQGKNLGKMLSLPLETGRRMGEGCLVHLSTAPQKCQKSAAPSGSQESDRGT